MGLTLTGCGTSSAPVSSGNGGGAATGNTTGPALGGADSAECSAFETAYKAFEAGAIPAGGSGNRWDQLENAVGNLFGGNMPTSQTGLDIFQVENDATSVSSDISQFGASQQDFATFNADLAKVGKDCGTTFTQATQQ